MIPAKPLAPPKKTQSPKGSEVSTSSKMVHSNSVLCSCSCYPILNSGPPNETGECFFSSTLTSPFMELSYNYFLWCLSTLKYWCKSLQVKMDDLPRDQGGENSNSNVKNISYYATIIWMKYGPFMVKMVSLRMTPEIH